MSTGKNSKSAIQAKRIAQLAQMNEIIFHTRDLANLWLIKNKNTLYTTLKRYQKAGLIYRIFKGLYSLLPVEKNNPYLLGAHAISNYCYLGAETVLFRSGFISQNPSFITFLSSLNKKIRIGAYYYKSRQLADRFLYNPMGIEKINQIQTATSERAIADMLYFNPHFHFDKKPDWNAVIKLQKILGYPLTPERYDTA